MRPSRSELQKVVAIASDHYASIALCGRKNDFIGSGAGRRSVSPITSCSCRSRASLTAAHVVVEEEFHFLGFSICGCGRSLDFSLMIFVVREAL